MLHPGTALGRGGTVPLHVRTCHIRHGCRINVKSVNVCKVGRKTEEGGE